MTAPALTSGSDPELLTVAEAVLNEQGYSVEVLAGTEVQLVLAENPYFVVAIAALHTIQDLLLAQSIAESALANRLNESPIGPKKWDAYLVLLTQERPPEDGDVTRLLYAINYDTARVRRIAHTGVDATPEAVSHALAPFVAPAEVTSTATYGDAFPALLDALVNRGVDRDLASRAVTAFEQGASLDDVL